MSVRGRVSVRVCGYARDRARVRDSLSVPGSSVLILDSRFWDGKTHIWEVNSMHF